MPLIPTTNSTALLILQQAQSASQPPQSRSPLDVLAAPEQRTSSQPEPLKLVNPVQSKLSEAIFSVNSVDINKLKLNLFDRAGDALGVDKTKYASPDDFIEAVQEAVRNLKLHGAYDVIKSVETDLGLDKMGISLDDLVDSATDPEANSRVTKALERQLGKQDEQGDSNRADGMTIDPDGIYAPVR